MFDNYSRQALDLFATFGDAEAIVAPLLFEDSSLDQPDGVRVTYAQLRERSLAMAATLWQNGVRPETTLCVLARNSADIMYVHFAAHLIGARTAWIAPNTPTSFRENFVTVGEVDMFLYDDRTMTKSGPEMAEFIAPKPVLKLTELLPVDGTFEVGPNPSTLVQTGGTTGTPKLILHKERFFLELRRFSDLHVASGAPPLKHLLVASVWHISSMTGALMTLFSGGTLFMHDGLDYVPFLRTVERERINSTSTTAGFLYDLMDNPLLENADTSSLYMLTVAGSAAAPRRLHQAIDRFGPVLRNVYGMSETPFITALPNVDHDSLLESVGKPYADIEVEVREGELKALPPGETGEVWVRGGLVMDQYWGMPELTAETIVDGWLRTGDVGRFDDDGNLYLVDRVKDMIVTGLGGTNVFCKPVEDALISHPEIRGAAVIGVPHDMMGEAVHAYVLTTAQATVTGDELRQAVSDQLNELWSPHSVEFVDEFPYTEFGKVDKKALRARYLAEHAA